MNALAIALLLVLSATAAADWNSDWRKNTKVWRGVHIMASSNEDLERLARQVPALAKEGLNAIVLETGYSFDFKSRPEMRDPNGITQAGAQSFTKVCRENGVRVTPQMNLFGHQSWAKDTGALLTKHPELDETPGLYPENKDIYCRSYCPRHPDLQKIVLPMIDELVEAFQADSFHVGMDEVFLISSDACPRCKGVPTATIFAEAVNDLHRHIVGKRKLQMLMWADRLIDGKATGYGEWEASENGTAPAVDMIPKDIVLCDWHYERRVDYPSVKMFSKKGFQVWPSTWKNDGAASLFALAARSAPGGKVLGHLVTTWGAVQPEGLATWPAFVGPMRLWR
jgi:hypothetical protein